MKLPLLIQHVILSGRGEENVGNKMLTLKKTSVKLSFIRIFQVYYRDDHFISAYVKLLNTNLER